jgi:hypothetical protein
MILEKTANPPDVYEYFFVEKADHLIDYDSDKAVAFVEHQLTDAGARGFHVVPQVIATLDVHDYGQVILMEKPRDRLSNGNTRSVQPNATAMVAFARFESSGKAAIFGQIIHWGAPTEQPRSWSGRWEAPLAQYRSKLNSWLMTRFSPLNLN